MDARFRGHADFTIRVLMQQAADAGGQIAQFQRGGVVGEDDGHANAALVGEDHVIDQLAGDHAGCSMSGPEVQELFLLSRFPGMRQGGGGRVDLGVRRESLW